MKEIIGSKVSIKNKKDNRGKIEIEYYSKDELERIIDMIRSIGNAKSNCFGCVIRDGDDFMRGRGRTLRHQAKPDRRDSGAAAGRLLQVHQRGLP